MEIRKLDAADAFVVVDLDGAERALGVIRCARKILRDGAVGLARSATYQLATLELRWSGASAGVNAQGEGRDAAMAAAVAELTPQVEAGQLLLDAGKGVTFDDLAPLHAVDPRPTTFWELRHDLVGASAVAAAETALGGLEGRTLALAQLDPDTAAVARAAERAGARIVAVAADDGSVDLADGITADQLVDQPPEALGTLVEDRPITAVDADVLAIGGKAGVVDHEVAAGLAARLLVPTAPVPVTSRGLAVARRTGCEVLPDFVTLSGPTHALLDAATAPALATEAASAAIAEVRDHAEGILLGACERAEAFLATWQDELPFGRPLA